MGTIALTFLPRAEKDLEQIVRHIAQDNPDAAERLGQKLIAKALSLVDERMIYVGTRVKKRPDIRKLAAGNFLILYRAFPEQEKYASFAFGMAPEILARCVSTENYSRAALSASSVRTLAPFCSSTMRR